MNDRVEGYPISVISFILTVPILDLQWHAANKADHNNLLFVNIKEPLSSVSPEEISLLPKPRGIARCCDIEELKFRSTIAYLKA